MKHHVTSNPNVSPFRYHVPGDVLEGILSRVAAYPWHEMPDDGGWEYGTNMDYLKDFAPIG